MIYTYICRRHLCRSQTKNEHKTFLLGRVKAWFDMVVTMLSIKFEVVDNVVDN